MNQLGWIRRAEGWSQEEIGAQDRLLGALEAHLEDLVSGQPDTVADSAARLAELSVESARRAKRLRVLLSELAPLLGQAPDGLATAARCLGEPARGLADLAAKLRTKAEANGQLTRRVLWLAGKQGELVRDLLGASCGLEPGADLETARGTRVDGLA